MAQHSGRHFSSISVCNPFMAAACPECWVLANIGRQMCPAEWHQHAQLCCSLRLVLIIICFFRRHAFTIRTSRAMSATAREHYASWPFRIMHKLIGSDEGAIWEARFRVHQKHLNPRRTVDEISFDVKGLHVHQPAVSRSGGQTLSSCRPLLVYVPQRQELRPKFSMN